MNFKNLTSNTDIYTKCFHNKLPISYQASNWMKLFQSHLNDIFSKIKIRKKQIKPSKADKYITIRNKLNKKGRKGNTNIDKKIEKLDLQIANIISVEGRDCAYEFNKYFNKTSTTSLQEIWKLKKKKVA